MTDTLLAESTVVGRPEGLAVLQRVVFPDADRLDTLALYVDRSRVLPTDTASGGWVDGIAGATQPGASASVAPEGGGEAILGRRSLRLEPGADVSLATYFNAFPASYWRRWTTLREVVLEVVVTGEGTVSVHRSTSRGAGQRVESHRVHGSATLHVTLPLTKFVDGGWYWFDLAAGEAPLELVEATWLGARPASTGTATLEITTMNKPGYCVANLAELGRYAEVLERLDEVLVVDQGTQRVQDAPGFADAAAALGGKLRIIEQANLGGSGGFARGMYEAVRNESTWVLLMDDDIGIEPESLLRLMTFADHCKRPTLVGAHMFDLADRTVMHAFGEVVNRFAWQYAPAPGAIPMRHDFGLYSLRNTPGLHRRVDVDYNGWWTDLIPTSVIKEIGLSLPIFIKWDDSEFGIRAQNAGYATVTLPGAAVWHESWLEKSDLVGWQAYFYTRNRLVSALLHSPDERPGRVVVDTNNINVKHLLSMQYSTVELRLLALRDLLAGPEHLFEHLASRIGDARRIAGQYSDGQYRADVDEFPDVQAGAMPKGGFRQPRVRHLIPWAASMIAKQSVAKVEPQQEQHPQVVIPHQDNTWWRTSHYRSALVSNAEGTGVSWYRRDTALFRKQLAASASLMAEVARSWPQLRRRYRDAAAHLTSFEAWDQVFRQHTTSEFRP